MGPIVARLSANGLKKSPDSAESRPETGWIQPSPDVRRLHSVSTFGWEGPINVSQSHVMEIDS